MRHLIGLLILVLIFLGIKEMHSYWVQIQSRGPAHTAEAGSDTTPSAQTASTAAADTLPGLPPHLEASLEAARKQGATGMKVWLRQNRAQVADPRLAAIELDYVIMVAGKNFGEARDVFAAVRNRTPTNSPVHPRIKKLEKNYQ